MTPAADAAPTRPHALIVDADPVLGALLEEWLDAHGWRVTRDLTGEGFVPGAFDVVVLDVPFARRDGLELVRRVAARHPASSIVALSASFFAGVDCSNAVAHSLGADCVLPKPVAREALLAALRRVQMQVE